MTDWLKIKNEYINTDTSYRKLAEKHSIPFSTIRDRATKEKWFSERNKIRNMVATETVQKTAEKIIEKEVNRIDRLLTASDKLLSKIEEATEQLNNHLITNKTKTKVVEYSEEASIMKPIKETIEETEDKQFIIGDIDRQGLKQLASALKDLKDIQIIRVDNTTNTSTNYELPATVIAPAFIETLIDIKNHNHTEYVLYGGRGSTKSSFISLVLVNLLMNNKDMHLLVCRMVGNTLKDSVYAQIKWAIYTLGLQDEFDFKVSPLEIIRKSTNQVIFFRGADDPQKIKSIKPSFGYIGLLWFEELDQFKGEKHIRNIEQSVVRGGDSAYIFKSFNPPKTANNWANKYIKTPKQTRYEHHSTFEQVPKTWLGKTFLEEAEHLKNINPKAYEHEYLGIANGTGGQVFDNVILRQITEDERSTFDRLYRGIDWGWYPDPNRYHLMHYDANRKILYVLDEISCNKTKNADFAELLKAKGVTYNDKITADSAENKSIDDFRSMGFLMYGAKKGPHSVDYSMKWLQSLNQIIIDNVACPECAKEFIDYEYEKNKDGDVISGYPDKNNHSIDAIRYALEEVWSRRGE